MITEQLTDDFGVAPTERRGELGTRKRPADLTAQLQPRLKMQFRRIDQRAVHVPDRREPFPIRHGFPRSSVPCWANENQQSGQLRPTAASSSALWRWKCCST